MAQTHPVPTPPASPTLGQRLQALTRRKTVLVLTFAAVLALTMPFVMGLPALYRASATVLVESQLPDGFVQGVGGEVDNRLQAIKQEALSRARLTELVEQFNLYPTLRGKVPMELLLAQVERDISIDIENTPGGRPTAIAFKITYTGKDPETVAAVANKLASFYIAQNDHIRSRQVTRQTDVLKQSLADTKKRLDAQEGRMQAYLSSHIGRLPQQMEGNLLALNRLNGQVQFNAQQQSTLMERRQELQKQMADLEMNVVSSAAATTSSDPAVKLAVARRELADLRSRFNEKYPDVRDKQAEVDRLEREASSATGQSPTTSALQAQRSMITTQLKEVEAKLDDLSRENRTLRSQIGNYEGRVESAPARGPEYDGLARDYQSTREAYDQLLRKYDEARLAETLTENQGGEEFRVLDAALPPPFAAGPNRMRLLVLALLGALVLAVGAALLVDQIDSSFHTVDELRSFTRVPVLVSIPRIHTIDDHRRRRVRIVAVAAATAMTLVLVGSGAFYYAHGSEGIARLLLKVG
jgi:polysaccharide chain length determinant protein (PEP-CTERM system associated)